MCDHVGEAHGLEQTGFVRRNGCPDRQQSWGRPCPFDTSPLLDTHAKEDQFDTDPLRNRLNEFVSVYTVGWAGAIMKDREM